VRFQRTSVGLDVHARSVVACALDRETGEVFERRLTPSREEVRDWIGSLPAPAAVVYEAVLEAHEPSSSSPNVTMHAHASTHRYLFVTVVRNRALVLPMWCGSLL
jgi:hypothetical protein